MIPIAVCSSRRSFVRQVSCLGAGLLAPWVLSGCGRETPVALGVHPWPGYEPLFLAEGFGWLPRQARLVPGSNAGDSLQRLRDRQIDAACLTLDEVLRARAEGIPLVVGLVFDESVGADVVLARPGIGSIQALRGKRIALEHSAVGNLVLHQLLERMEADRASVRLVDLSPDKHLAAWQAGEIDAAISYAPFSSHLMRAGAQRLFDSRQFPGLILDVLAVHAAGLARQTQTWRAVLQAYFRALDHLRVNREDGLRRIAALRQLTLAETEQNFAGLNLPDRTANARMLAAGGDVVRAARLLNDLLLKQGLLSKPDNLQGLLSTDLLPAET